MDFRDFLQRRESSETTIGPADAGITAGRSRPCTLIGVQTLVRLHR
jgi:hypothetical protein